MIKKFLFLLICIGISLSAKELKLIAPWEFSSIDPTRSGGYIFNRMEVSQTLVAIKENGELKPQLAKNWSVSKDGLEWKFKIRKNVYFHNKEKLTPKIIAYNFNTQESKTKSILKYLPIKEITYDKDNLIVKLNSPFNVVPEYFTHTSTTILAKESFSKNSKVIKIIGTGAYKIKKLTAPLKLELVRFDEYWGEKANIEKVQYLAVGKAETRALMLKAKEADIAYTILPTSLKSLQKYSNLNIKTVVVPRITMIKLNSGHEFLKDVKARKALSYLIDRKNIAKAILKDENLASSQIFPTSLATWHNKQVAPLSYNIKKAQELLSQLGWKKSKDGFLYKDGKKFSLTLHTYSNRPTLPLIATVIQDQFKKAGIELKVSIGNYTKIVQGHKDNTLELALISRNFSLVPTPLSVLLKDYDKNGGDWGAMNWDNPKMFSLLNLAKEKRDLQINKQITAILQDELPSIPVTWTPLTVVYNNSIENLQIDPFESNYNLSKVKWKNKK